MIYVRFIELVLILGCIIFLTCIDEKHISISRSWLRTIEDQYGGWYSCSEKEVGWESDDGFEDVFFDGLLSDFLFT